MTTRRILVHVTCTVAVDVPEDSVLLKQPESSLRSIQEELDRTSNYWSDGRYPYSVETLHYAAAALARGAVEDRVSDLQTKRFGLDRPRAVHSQLRWDAKIDAVERELRGISCRAVGDGPITTRVELEPDE